ncbi:hypothetical protein [Deinococcus pimensis]|uniref:hypothetical protein n=1 Tax=Deinococcus pimensis TaxID=309888 RepID=UPI00047F7D0F|nr:hypothetical protein [Deinococcus pimensis]
MRTTTLLGAFLISTSLLTACGTPPVTTPAPLPGGGINQPTPQPGTRTISGTVTAPGSADVQGTYLIVCPVKNDACDWDNADGVVIEQTGRQATFTTGTLADGEYAVIAWKDNAPKGEFGAEDNLGIYSPDEKTLGRVRPSTANVNVTMLAFDEPGAATPPADAPRTAVPAELVGKWSTTGTSGGGYYNPVSGTWTPGNGNGMWYQINADGTFVFSSYIESNMYGCNINFFKYHTGTVAVQGDRVVFTATNATQKFEDTCNASRSYEKQWYPNPDQYRWGVGVRDGRSAMVLVEDGKQEGLFFYRD